MKLLQNNISIYFFLYIVYTIDITCKIIQSGLIVFFAVRDGKNFCFESTIKSLAFLFALRFFIYLSDTEYNSHIERTRVTMTAKNELLNGKKHIHFIGIGGAGMLPIAQILHTDGFYLTGSDNNPSDNLELVKSLGIPVMMGQCAENIKGADLIVYTAAIMSDNEELIAAKASGVTVVERSVLLGEITRRYDDVICVCGTHGKTTVTAMLTQILLEAGKDPTAVIGGRLPAINGNGISGKSDLMVCEACEYVDTFLKLSPSTAVVLNIDEDHMEYFKTIDNLVASFTRFCSMAKKSLIVNGDDAEALRAVEAADTSGKSVTTFGFSEKNDFFPREITHLQGVHTSLELWSKSSGKLGVLDLYVPGRHNVLNCIAAAVAAMEEGVSFEQVKTGLSNFKGAGRRFEVLGIENGITVADDYAHHPAELEATLKAAKELNFSRIIAVHQPFTYSRTKLHLDAFARVLSIADEVVLTEIMGSREKNTIGIYSSDLAAKIKGAYWFGDFESVAEKAVELAKPGDLIITMSCGDVYKVAKLILKKLKADKA